MTLQALALPAFDDADTVFDFSRPRAAANDAAPFGRRGDPEPGWATQRPDKAMLFLFVTPRDGAMVEELLAL
jgi:hypothetical protein